MSNVKVEVLRVPRKTKCPVKLFSTATPPRRAHEDDLGADTGAVSRKIGFFKVVYDTGIAIASPKGAFWYPRSSVHFRYLYAANSIGVIDPQYRGTIKVVFYASLLTYLPWLRKEKGRWRFSWNRFYEVGDRIGQLVFHNVTLPEFNVVNSLQATNRNKGGYGSTGHN